jgi:uncharacterized PurR-regulated membrane protein YhhQ (DUF165 family)
VSIANRVIAAIIGVAAMAAAAGVVVVAAAFAIYSLLRDRFGPAGAAAIIAAGFAVALALAALLMFSRFKAPTSTKRASSADRPSAMTDKIIALLTERPIIAAAAAAAAGLLAWRNPTLVATILKALDLNPPSKPPRR